jgi:membrane protein implicated in regulation of membrane protease activity
MTLLWWHWFVFGLLLMLGELATPGGFYIIFFGIGAMLVGLLSAMELAGPSWVQWLLFSLISVGSLLLFRSRLLRWMQINPQRPQVDALVDEIGTASTALEPGDVGKVELRGSSWSARNVSQTAIARGARCRVIGVDGLMLKVAPEGAR